MKHFVTTLLAITLVAGAAGLVCFHASGDDAVQQALAKQNEMEWLRTDFQLSDAQFAAIKTLHENYSVVCGEHCRAIQQATRERNALKTSGTADPAALAAADRRVEELRLVCESAIATHVRECAALMSPEAGRRYLALVLPKIKDFDHVAPPSLKIDHAKH